MRKRIKFKCDVFGIGQGVAGLSQAAATAYAAGEMSDASRYAADQAYQGQTAANNANIEIANKTNAANIQMQRENNKANLDLAYQQNQWNLEQWNRQNDYNAPANQMKLYKDAGMNPNMVAGQFSPAQQLTSANLANQVSPQATAVPNIINPAAESSQIMANGAIASAQMKAQAVSSAVQAAKGLAELKKVKAETGAIQTLTPKQADKLVAETNILVKQHQWYDKMSDADWKVKIAEIQRLDNTVPLLKETARREAANAALSEFDYGVKQKIKDILIEMPKAELQKIYSDIKKNQAEIGNLGASAAQTRWFTKYYDENKQSLPSPKSGKDELLYQLISYLSGKYGVQNFWQAAEMFVKDIISDKKKYTNDFPLIAPYNPTAPIP